jgi:FtsH-binding integral membrane protein
MTDTGSKPPAISWRGPTWHKGMFPDAEGMIFIRRIYDWMCLGLIVSAAIAYWTYITPTLASFVTFEVNGFIFICILIVEIIFALWIAGHIHNFSGATSLIIFLIYSALNGFVLSAVFSALGFDSIIIMFLVIAALFVTMSMFSYFAKTDLTTLGRFTVMALLGIAISTIVNIFLKSDFRNFAIADFGVLVFVVLTLLHTVMLKRLFDFNWAGGSGGKAGEAINGTLMITSDFSVLFVALISITGHYNSQQVAWGLLESLGKDDSA